MDTFQKGVWYGAITSGNLILILLLLMGDLALHGFTAAISGVNTGFFVSLLVSTIIPSMARARSK